MTINGEINFSMEGFLLQGSSQLFESTKTVLQALVLTSAGWKLDALSYVLIVMPLCFVILSSVLLILKFVYPLSFLEVPDKDSFVQWWPHLLANSSLAFLLNIVIALFVITARRSRLSS